MDPACIESEVLSDFLAGRVSGNRAAELEVHLATCSKCQAEAERHNSQSDSLLAAARSAVVSEPIEKEPELAKALSAIGHLRSPASKGAAGIDLTRSAAPEIRNYRLIKILGEGGMGTVYRAVHVHLEKTVALKIMKSDRSGNPQAVSRFEREMKAIGRLEHPHIVRALDAGEQRGVYFLVMEFIEGIDLDQLIRSLGPLPVADACEIARQAALGLAHAHEHNLVHRDVKPSNLMLAPDGHIKVLDLGLAQFQQSVDGGLELTLDGQMIGTLLYMSPEQLAGGKNIDHRSDIFSLGVTLYCLLAGGLPLDRGQPAAMLPAINKLRNDIPPDVQSLLLKLLAAAPEDRISSMSQVARLLQSSASGRPLTKLLKQVQNRTVERAALPPSVLPSQSPPVQGHNAKVETTRANLDTRLIVASRRRSAPSRPLLSWSNSTWAAAGLALTVLAALVVVIAWPKQNLPVVPGTLLINCVNSVQPRLTQQVDIRAIDLAGKVVHLLPGPNSLTPGLYRLETDDNQLRLSKRSIEIIASQTYQLEVILPTAEAQPPSRVSLLATIPEASGPLVHYTGDLWYKDAGSEKSCTFDLTLRAKDEELLGGVPHRWIEIEAVTQTVGGAYTETGLLLVNPTLYKNESSFVVKQGWLAAESESVKRRLAYRFPTEKLPRIAVEYDQTDKLKQRADELNVGLPSERLSVQQALVLLFSAPVPTAPEPFRTWRILPANDRNRIEKHEPSLRPRRHVVQSAPDAQFDAAAKGYLIDVNDDVPFGFMQLMIKNDNFRLKCSYLSSNDTHLPAPPDKTSFDKQASDVVSLPKFEPDPIGEALLPPAEGALAKYLGSLERDGQPSIDFEAQLRMGGTEQEKGVDLRVLEIRTVTFPPLNGARHVEEATLRIDPKRYQAGEFRIEDGWFQTDGETFQFEPGGDLTKAEDGLLMLGKRLPDNRFSVHDLLGLMFGAQLRASAGVGKLRTDVRRKLLTTGRHRDFEEAQFPRRGRPSLTADRWIIPKRDGLQLNYEIVRSRMVPFDFCRVDFEISQPQKFKLVTGLDDDQERDAPSLFAGTNLPTELSYGTTRRRIDGKASNPNKKVWRDVAGKLIEFAEFAGTTLDATGKRVDKVLLQSEGGELIQKKLSELSSADQEWVAQGRYWGGEKLRRQYIHYYLSGGQAMVILKSKDGEEQQRAYESFQPADQTWIARQVSSRRQQSPVLPSGKK